MSAGRRVADPARERTTALTRCKALPWRSSCQLGENSLPETVTGTVLVLEGTLDRSFETIVSVGRVAAPRGGQARCGLATNASKTAPLNGRNVHHSPEDRKPFSSTCTNPVGRVSGQNGPAVPSPESGWLRAIRWQPAHDCVVARITTSSGNTSLRPSRVSSP